MLCGMGNRLVSPLIFIIVSSLIYSISNSFFHFEDDYENKLGNNNSATSAISNGDKDIMVMLIL